jgi:hypothetical protein
MTQNWRIIHPFSKKLNMFLQQLQPKFCSGSFRVHELQEDHTELFVVEGIIFSRHVERSRKVSRYPVCSLLRIIILKCQMVNNYPIVYHKHRDKGFIKVLISLLFIYRGTRFNVQNICLNNLLIHLRLNFANVCR